MAAPTLKAIWHYAPSEGICGKSAFPALEGRHFLLTFFAAKKKYEYASNLSISAEGNKEKMYHKRNQRKGNTSEDKAKSLHTKQKNQRH